MIINSGYAILNIKMVILITLTRIELQLFQLQFRKRMNKIIDSIKKAFIEYKKSLRDLPNKN